MRKIRLRVGGSPAGKATTWAYPRGFVRFNNLLIALSGATGASRDDALHQIARSRLLSITYDRATRPPLVAL